MNKTADKRVRWGNGYETEYEEVVSWFSCTDIGIFWKWLWKKAQSTKQEKNQTESTDVDMQDTKLKADISFWSFQIGTWGDETAVQSVIKKFNEKYPNIHVTYQALDYETGDTVVADALEKRKDLTLLWKDRNDW